MAGRIGSAEHGERDFEMISSDDAPLRVDEVSIMDPKFSTWDLNYRSRP